MFDVVGGRVGRMDDTCVYDWVMLLHECLTGLQPVADVDDEF